MVLVPAGTFFMGSDDANFPRWSPPHKVRITRPFCLDRREVTAAAYKACVEVGECQRADLAPTFPAVGITPAENEANQAAFAELCNLGPDNTIKPGRENHPVNCVAWDRADTYCRSFGKRLPTEAEWEYAARGSDGRKYPWGDEPGGDGQHMNACGSEFWAWQAAHRIVDPSAKAYDLDDGHVGTAPVGSFPKGRTKLGLDDMIGNVWEWTQDGYADYTPDEQRDPSGAASGENKVMRGGGFNSGNLVFVNPAFRYHFPAKSSSHVLGFRCARSLDEPTSGGLPKP
jgi:formylglycine-generating enzyme required for sulfatase activity